MEMHDDSRMREAEEDTKGITSRQKDYLEAYRKHGSAAKAANALGVSVDSANEALKRVAKTFGKKSISELKEGEMKAKSATSSELMRLIKRQEYRCALSGEKLTPNTAELDHIIPRCRGGSDTIDNLQWLDKNVNRMKGRMTVEEFVAVCKRVVSWTS